MKVVAIDPGTHTGIAWGTWEPVVGWCKWKGNEGTFGVEQVNCPDEVEGLFRIWEVLDREEPDVLVVEDFILLPPEAMRRKGGWSSDRRGLSPTRLGFGLKVLLSIQKTERFPWAGPLDAWSDRVEVVWQMPGEMMAVSDDWLRKEKLWRTPTRIEGARPGDGPHAMDALRHLIIWGRKNGC